MPTRHSITFYKLPDEISMDALIEQWPALGPDGEINDERDIDDTRNPTAGTGELSLYGNSKWGAEEAGAALLEISKAHPAVSIDWNEEWDGDDPSSSRTVIRGGERIASESMHLQFVPDDLPELMDKLREALSLYKANSPASADEVANHARALMDAVDPRGGQRSASSSTLTP